MLSNSNARTGNLTPESKLVIAITSHLTCTGTAESLSHRDELSVTGHTTVFLAADECGKVSTRAGQTGWAIEFATQALSVAAATAWAPPDARTRGHAAPFVSAAAVHGAGGAGPLGVGGVFYLARIFLSEVERAG